MSELTNRSRGGGRPPEGKEKSNAFKRWLKTCNMTPDEVVAAISDLLGTAFSRSSIYGLRNGHQRPSREVALAIEKLTYNVRKGRSACPASMWDAIPIRVRDRGNKN